MPSPMPVPLELRLPEGWHAASPERVGVPDAAFVAVHAQPDEGFTANVTVDSAYRPDAATLAEIGDESVRNLSGVAESLNLTSRHEIGSAAAPGLTQTLTLTTVVRGVLRELAQSQVCLSLLDVHDPDRRMVVRLILTTTAAQHDDLLEDFRDIVATVHPAN
ncbi:hypothetical protein [Streptomyces lasiicapitis]|uniref:DUF1795 domain-containing protein n=1 Tax=Streptomyces lasiicapitis TaxID=1923961 RepID=A0ABQ2M6X9_9ACTN|nr:hypothetical protein [Streptomyces lasiicapitis]GGO47603.1 hypothetical protein GCM10012286_41280 [Streptomyces lasiicapitis]